MAGKKEVQKTVAFRLNLSRSEERELYQEIMKHGRNVENDIYGSSGAYVKAALRYYHRQESRLELQEQYRQEMQDYMRELAEEQGKVFLERLAEHDKRLVAMVVEAVMNVFYEVKISNVGADGGQGAGDSEKQSDISPAESMTVEVAKTVGMAKIPESAKTLGIVKAEQGGMAEDGNEVDESLPEEALLYLSSL